MNTDLDSSLGKSLSVCVISILLKQDIIFFIIAKGTTTTEILEEIPLFYPVLRV